MFPLHFRFILPVVPLELMIPVHLEGISTWLMFSFARTKWTLQTRCTLRLDTYKLFSGVCMFLTSC